MYSFCQRERMQLKTWKEGVKILDKLVPLGSHVMLISPEKLDMCEVIVHNFGMKMKLQQDDFHCIEIRKN